MTKAPSLALRVIVLLAFAQLPAFLIVWLTLIALNLANYRHVTELDELAIARTTDLVAGSLLTAPDGSLRIEPTPELRSEIQRVPKLRFAAFDRTRWMPVAGSSEELTSVLSGLASSKPCHMHFTLGDLSPEAYIGHLACRWTPFGRVPIALSGQKFAWRDILELFDIDWSWMATSVFVGAVLSAGTAWVAMRRGLRPLDDVAKEVEQIQMNSLHQKLSTFRVPAEIRSLVNGMNEALKRLDSGVERQRRFAANAAHELRTPLAIMRARLENAKASSLKSELMGDTDQLRSIVEQMLVSTRLAEGQVPLDQRVDLEKAIRQLVSDLAPLAIDRGRFLEFDGAVLPLVTSGNQRAIESVVTNLIDNSLREEPKGGTVCVSMDEDGVIAIIDHGKGVRPEDREMIFERFWRKSDASSGTGLGLAIAKEIMDAHKGRIWVEETPGGGATFKLWFPKLVSN